MLYYRNLFILLAIIILIGNAGCQKTIEKSRGNAPVLLFGDIECMQEMHIQHLNGKDVHNLNRLFLAADEALSIAPFSVMDKKRTPPSGDKHDYMSQGPYWWPDPEKPDGLPYIRRDGEVNPERASFTDQQYLSKLINLVEILSKAYYFSKDEKYAAKFTALIRIWFLDEATKMNPNLNFGQGIPGRTEGRGIGIIETSKLRSLVDAIALIRVTTSWTKEDEAGMQAWCKAYLNWLMTSKHGQDEAIHPNNHGTWYDVQASALAIYTQQDNIARELVELAKTRRLDAHIMEDGSQPRELARTRSWNYSSMNLWGLMQLAQIATHLNMDLWNYPSREESKLRKALDYLLPFALGEQAWPHEQIVPFDAERIIPHLVMVVKVFPNEGYEEKVRLMKEKFPKDENWGCLD